MDIAITISIIGLAVQTVLGLMGLVIQVISITKK